MIKNIKYIKNLAVFQDFDWSKEVRSAAGSVENFSNINIIYGRNYSGKTTLSRIMRAMEIGFLSEKYTSPSFSVLFQDRTEATQGTLTSHGKIIRVFNEDFVRENLRFISHPDDSVAPFAILGDDNNKIEREIELLAQELGSQEPGNETALYAKYADAKKEYRKIKDEYNKDIDSFENKLSLKATDKQIGIKYKPERFGDQNYNIANLKKDIETVIRTGYLSLTDEQLIAYEKLIQDKPLSPIPHTRIPDLQISLFIDEAEILVTKKISASDKIDELIKNAVLNRWVSEGRGHHKNTRDNCAFCDNPISEDRWKELDRHFDQESEELEERINFFIQQLDIKKKSALSALSINKSLFYSKFHGELDLLTGRLNSATEQYSSSVDILIEQLTARKNDLLNPINFQKPEDISGVLFAIHSAYEEVRKQSEEFTKSLSKDQVDTKKSLRLNEVANYIIEIGYLEQCAKIEQKKSELDAIEISGKKISDEINTKKVQLAAKKRELNDEEKGAKKVNEYLTHFFGHQYLSLQAQMDDVAGEEGKKIRFEVIRDGKKAYHLSEGECSLLAFCYFIAKLDDIDTKDSKPIIWIDDPISSLDSNHIFFIYSLINAEIVASSRFKQLFVSTHNLDFLKYLKRLTENGFFIVSRQEKTSTIKVMPKYLKKYVSEFNYLFHQIYKCAIAESIDDSNYTIFYNFGNNARKFFEIYLYYKYPDHEEKDDNKFRRFFGGENIPVVLMDRINNEYSHLAGVFERGATPIEVPEMQIAARQIIAKLKEDTEQYAALLRSIGETEESSIANT